MEEVFGLRGALEEGDRPSWRSFSQEHFLVKRLDVLVVSECSTEYYTYAPRSSKSR